MDYFTPQFLCTSLLLCCTTAFLLCIFRLRNSKSGNLPASPMALPVIGHLHLLTDKPHQSFTRLANQLGPIIHLRLGRVPTLIVSSANSARLVLKTHDHVFASRPQLLAAQYMSFGCSDVTFSPYGPYWRQVRKICMVELLNSKRVSSFKTVRDEEVKRMVNNVWHKSSGKEVDMSKLFSRLTDDVMCRVALGKRFTRREGTSEKSKHELARVFEEMHSLFAGFSVADYYPEWKWVVWVSGLKRRYERNMQELREACDEIIREHIEDNERDREDLVDVLLREQRREDLELPITDDNLKALLLDMFVAGTDTTSTTLEWTMTELARHPRVLKKAQQEVRKVASGNGEVDETHLQQLHYLKAAVKEAMRLHPPVPFLVPRESIDNCDLDGYQIPAKTRVLINTYAIGRDPESWEDPLVYNPERFEDDSTDFKDQDFRFLPFGSGRRGCPGSTFGLAVVEIALARLLYHFDWALPQGIVPDDVDTDDIFGLTMKKKSALVLVPTTNKDYELKGIDAEN